jgi:hypothetical protein
MLENAAPLGHGAPDLAQQPEGPDEVQPDHAIEALVVHLDQPPPMAGRRRDHEHIRHAGLVEQACRAARGADVEADRRRGPAGVADQLGGPPGLGGVEVRARHPRAERRELERAGRPDAAPGPDHGRVPAGQVEEPRPSGHGPGLDRRLVDRTHAIAASCDTNISSSSSGMA